MFWVSKKKVIVCLVVTSIVVVMLMTTTRTTSSEVAQVKKDLGSGRKAKMEEYERKSVKREEERLSIIEEKMEREENMRWVLNDILVKFSNIKSMHGL